MTSTEIRNSPCRSDDDDTLGFSNIHVEGKSMEVEWTLTLDLQIEILTWLPAPVVLKFRFVSKAWNVATRSTNFRDQHLTRSLRSQTDTRRPTNFLLVPRENGNATEILQLDQKEEHQWSLTSLPSDHRLVSACHGLLCLDCHDSRNCCIFNPTTNESLLIPPPADSNVRLYGLGFGFDTLRNKYKVVAVTRLNDDNRWGDTVVCTVSQRGDFTPWRFLKQSQIRIQASTRHSWNPELVLNGKLHWVVLEKVLSSTASSWFPTIVSFDLHSEQLELLPIDKVISKPWIWAPLVLVQLEDCLGLVRILQGQVLVFKMVEYQNCKSWTLTYEFYSELLEPLDTVPSGFTGLSCLWKDGKLYICWDDVIMSCDSKTSECVIISDATSNFFGFPSITSLISLSNTTYRDSSAPETS